MTTPNAERAYKVLDLARANREHFDMGNWGDSPDGGPVSLDDLTKTDCGTTACLAGWTVAMAGYSVNSHAAVFNANGDYVGDASRLARDMLGVDSVVAGIFGPRPGGAS